MNPYASPLLEWDDLAPAPLWPEEAREQLRLPAYGLMVTGVVGAVLASAAMLAALFAPTEPDRALFSPLVDRSMTLVAGVLLVVVQAGIVRGGWAMLHLRAYQEARLGVLLAVISLGGAFLIGLPFGIWALLRLIDGRVRGAFPVDNSGSVVRAEVA